MDSYTELEPAGSPSGDALQAPGKVILHFSDGTLDLDELDEPRVVNQPVPVDPQKLSWGPWMWYYTMSAGGKALEVCDYMGEFLADLFGITTPKYQYEITEYHRMKREEGLKRQRDLEKNSSWTDNDKHYIVTDMDKSTAEKYELKTCNTSTLEKC